MPNPTATIFLPYHALDDVLLRGTRAAQPAATAVTPGTLYGVTDEGNRLERSSGTAWELYGLNPSALPAAGSTTQVQFNDAGIFGGDAGLVYDKTTDVLTVNGGSVQGGDLVFSNNAAVRRNTADGSDNGSIVIQGGGGSTNARGAEIYLYGNEHASQAGRIFLQVGNATGSGLFVQNNAGTTALQVTGSNGGVTFTATAEGVMWLFNSTGANGGAIRVDRSSVAKGYFGISSLFVSGGSADDFAIRAENNLVFSNGTTRVMQLTGASSINVYKDIVFGTGGSVIRRDTGDGSDNGAVYLAGGGDITTGRGGYIVVYGNEVVGAPGAITCNIGNVAGSYLKVLNSAAGDAFTIIGSSGQAQFTSSVNGYGITFTNTNAGPAGLIINYSAASPNSAGSEFILCIDNIGQRFTARSNGGLANYQANDVNLSDEDVKDISGLAGIERGRFAQLNFVLARYKDSPQIPDDVMLTAQDVQKVYPDLVGEFSDGHLGVREHGIIMRGLKVIQEHDGLIESLLARIERLERR